MALLLYLFADAAGKGGGESSECVVQGLSTMATLTSIATGSRNWTGFHAPIQSTEDSGSRDKDSDVTHTVPILPWLTGNGGVNTPVLKNLSRRVMGIVMLNPGILEVRCAHFSPLGSMYLTSFSVCVVVNFIAGSLKLMLHGTGAPCESTACSQSTGTLPPGQGGLNISS